MISAKDIKLKTTNEFIISEPAQIIGYDRNDLQELNYTNYKIKVNTPLKFKELIIKRDYLSPHYPILENLPLNIRRNLRVKKYKINTKKVNVNIKLFLKYQPIFNINYYLFSFELDKIYNLRNNLNKNDNILAIGKQPFFLELFTHNNEIKNTNNYYIQLNKFKNSRDKDFKDLDEHLVQNKFFLNKYKNNINYINFEDNIYKILNISVPKQKLIFIHYLRFDSDIPYGSNTFMQFYYITLFIYALENLQKNGNFIIFALLFTKKIIMDLIVIAKQFFKKTTFYTPEIIKIYNFSDKYIVFEGFKGLDDELQNILDALKKVLKKIEVIYPNDVDDFNIYENEIREKYKINKPITSVKPYLDTLLNISTKKRINLYQDIINFNQGEFIRLKETFQKKFSLLNVPLNSLPQLPTIEQISKSTLYLRNFGIEFNDYSKENELFRNKLGRSILHDLYGLHQPIIYGFKTTNQFYTIRKPNLELKSNKKSKKKYKQNKSKSAKSTYKKTVSKKKSNIKFSNVNDAIDYFKSYDIRLLISNKKSTPQTTNSKNNKNLNESNEIKHLILKPILDDLNLKLSNVDRNISARSFKKKNKLKKIKNNLDFYNPNIKYSIIYFLKKLIPKEYYTNQNLNLKWTIIFEIINELDFMKSNKTYNILFLSENYEPELESIQYYSKIAKFNLNYLTSQEFKKKTQNLSSIDDILKIEQKYIQINTIFIDNDKLTEKNNIGLIINTNTYKNDYDVFKQLFTCIKALKSGDNLIFKLKLPLSNKSIINLIYLLYNHFQKLYFYKPIQEKYTLNFYLIGNQYSQIDDEFLETILYYIDEINNEKLDFNDLDLFNGIYPDIFGIQLEHIISQLINNYVNLQEKQIYYYDNYKYLNKDLDELSKNFTKEKNIEWIKRYKFKK